MKTKVTAKERTAGYLAALQYSQVENIAGLRLVVNAILRAAARVREREKKDAVRSQVE
jgi:hypothetical protein